jgi:hypothetical protein
VELVDALCGFAEPSINCQVKMRKERGTKKRRVYDWHQSTEKQTTSFSIHDKFSSCALGISTKVHLMGRGTPKHRLSKRRWDDSNSQDSTLPQMSRPRIIHQVWNDCHTQPKPLHCPPVPSVLLAAGASYISSERKRMSRETVCQGQEQFPKLTRRK